MLEMFTGLSFALGLALFLSLAFVLAYEFINGFHDTANAVATVIYTKAMPPHMAVVASGIFNFLGVMIGGLGVAYAIVHLLPVDLLLNIDSSKGMIMVFSLLTAAIFWNLGTWYFGIPSSSSHTLIGSILGVGGAYALLEHLPLADGINTKKATDIMLSLLISPLVGFIIAALVLLLLKRIWPGQKIHKTPQERENIDGKKHPPFWTRATLVASAMGLSFVHGSNDGQKGIGMVMLVLICMAPAHFVLDLNTSAIDIDKTRHAATYIESIYKNNQEAFAKKIDFAKSEATLTSEEKCSSKNALVAISSLGVQLKDVTDYSKLSIENRREVRRILLCIDDTAKKMTKVEGVSGKDKDELNKLRKEITATTEFAPYWAIVAVALALGLGTMTGWRRVVKTVGEKIGKTGMTYSQGMSAQVTAATAIGIASITGMPVSTTHVLSSAVAGTMVANKSGLQFSTIKTILMAWVLTLPATILLAGGLFYVGAKVFL
ncbi:phosphate transporter [Cellvibrio zantedeschiae]|uniref:Phosphate transporter n=1 Tax=Cellvibrio zantedeschiae TaxID=1237077 RepID=A0ABQ3AYB9_9GAMM|nr:inorganic phosphate transporter [Cellvibrio zantedeschiae]GGY70302.1 phosphate transporter [Cellvibrio zantedeschiae]